MAERSSLRSTAERRSRASVVVVSPRVTPRGSVSGASQTSLRSRGQIAPEDVNDTMEALDRAAEGMIKRQSQILEEVKTRLSVSGFVPPGTNKGPVPGAKKALTCSHAGVCSRSRNPYKGAPEEEPAYRGAVGEEDVHTLFASTLRSEEQLPRMDTDSEPYISANTEGYAIHQAHKAYCRAEGMLETDMCTGNATALRASQRCVRPAGSSQPARSRYRTPPRAYGSNAQASNAADSLTPRKDADRGARREDQRPRSMPRKSVKFSGTVPMAVLANPAGKAHQPKKSFVDPYGGDFFARQEREADAAVEAALRAEEGDTTPPPPPTPMELARAAKLKARSRGSPSSLPPPRRHMGGHKKHDRKPGAEAANGSENLGATIPIVWAKLPQPELKESIVGAPIVSGSTGRRTDDAVADYTAMWSAAAVTEEVNNRPARLKEGPARLLRMFKRQEDQEDKDVEDEEPRPARVCTLPLQSQFFKDFPYDLGDGGSDSPVEILDFPWDDIENKTLEEGSKYIFEVKARVWGVMEDLPEAAYEDIVRGLVHDTPES